jgi:glycosyltransferase involved in cell wall biosynthesis
MSEHSRRELGEYFGEEFLPKVTVIPGGANLERFVPVPDPKERNQIKESLGLPPHRKIVLTVRRLVKRMGLENLVEAFARLSAQDPQQYGLVIVGGGPLQDTLQAQISRLRVEDHVWLAGKQYERLSAYYQCADVFVLPTVALEGFGLVTVEALACGTPVLGTPVGATPEILRPLGEEYLLDGCKVEHIEAGLRRFFASYDPARRDEARRREYVVSRYSWEAVATQYEELYEETIVAKQRAVQRTG